MARHGENIRKRADGRWEARYVFREGGKTCCKSLYGETYLQAKKKRDQAMAVREQTTPPRIFCEGELTLCQLLERWLSWEKTNLKPSTWARYHFLMERHIFPELGNRMLTELTSEELALFTRKKLENGRIDGTGGLSPKTVSDILSVIKLGLCFGKEHHLAENKELSIRRPRQKLPQIQVFTKEEQKKLEFCLMSSMCTENLGILTSLYTGLRIGEICALRWEDIELQNGILRVRRTVLRIPEENPQKGGKTKLIMGTPKTEASLREIPLPGFLFALMNSYQSEKRYYVATGTAGYYEPRSFYRYYKRLLETCGLSEFNYHALRHTFATRCVESGFDIKSLAEILGHANISTTLQRYVHPSMELKQQHMKKLDSISVCGHKTGRP